MQTNIAILQRLNATAELQDLLMRTLQAACAISDGASGRIILYDPNDDTLTVRAEYADGQLQARNTLTQEAAHYTPYIDEPTQPATHQQNAHGLYQLVQPLVGRGALVGLLHLERPSPFNMHERDLLMGLVSYSAVALQNAYLFDRASATNRELQLLVEASSAVTSSLDFDEVLRSITRYMMRALHADWCVIADYDAETGILHHLAENRAARWEGGQASAEWQHTVREMALQHGQLYRAGWEQAPALLQGVGARQVLGVPIHAGERVRGLLEVYTTEEAPFSHEQVSAAVRGGIALAAKFDELTPAHYEQAKRTCLEAEGNGWCTMFTWDGRELCGVFSAGYGLRDPHPAFDTALMPNVSITLNELRIGELRRGEAALSDEEDSELLKRDMGLMVMLPLVVKEKAVGLIQVMFANRERRVSRRELGLANSLARQAAIALENARLVRDLQHSLSQQKNMQAQLVRAARLSVLGELSATLAHQISNPLTIILGDAEILMEDLDDPATRESAEAIYKAGKRARQVVMRILKMARHEEKPERQTVNKTLRETLELLNPQINRQGIRTSANLPERDLPVMAAAGQLEDIWSNLVLNAHDAILARPEAEGAITITAWGDKRSVYITVSDDGVGISQEKLEQVFSPLYTTKPMGQGTGLGLYVVRQILDTLYGSIEIESTINRGTTVTVTLPLATDTDLENDSGTHSGGGR